MKLNDAVHLPDEAEQVLDADEEIFSLYVDERKAPPSKGLGFLSTDPLLDLSFTIEPPALNGYGKSKSATRRPVEVSLSIHQDPSSLKSRKGDTSSVVWQASLLFARFLLSQHHFPPLDQPRLVNLAEAHVLEVGSGTGILAALIAQHCASYTATDHADSLHLLRKNAGKVAQVEELDWLHPGKLGRDEKPPDIIFAIDCIFNEALVAPLIGAMTSRAGPETVALVVCELRSSEVLQLFLETWLAAGWQVWRVRSAGLSTVEELASGRFVVHALPDPMTFVNLPIFCSFSAPTTLTLCSFRAQARKEMASASFNPNDTQRERAEGGTRETVGNVQGALGSVVGRGDLGSENRAEGEAKRETAESKAKAHGTAEELKHKAGELLNKIPGVGNSADRQEHEAKKEAGKAERNLN